MRPIERIENHVPAHVVIADCRNQKRDIESGNRKSCPMIGIARDISAVIEEHKQHKEQGIEISLIDNWADQERYKDETDEQARLPGSKQHQIGYDEQSAISGGHEQQRPKRACSLAKFAKDTAGQFGKAKMRQENSQE